MTTGACAAPCGEGVGQVMPTISLVVLEVPTGLWWCWRYLAGVKEGWCWSSLAVVYERQTPSQGHQFSGEVLVETRGCGKNVTILVKGSKHPFRQCMDRGAPIRFAGIRRSLTKSCMNLSLPNQKTLCQGERTQKDKAEPAGQRETSRQYGRDSDTTNNSIIITIIPQ